MKVLVNGRLLVSRYSSIGAHRRKRAGYRIITQRITRFYSNQRILNAQRSQVNALSEKLRVTHLDGFYKHCMHDLRLAGNPLFVQQGVYNTLYNCLVTLFPAHKWLAWNFKTMHAGGWDDIEMQRNFLDYIGMYLDIQDMSDWYHCNHEDIIALGGEHLLKKSYDGSFTKMLERVYPDFKWLTTKFTHAPRRYWHDINNQRAQFNNIAKKLNIKHLDDWYNVHRSKIGYKLDYVIRRSSNLYESLSGLYPEHNWDPLSFRYVSGVSWRDRKSVISYLKKLAASHDISNPVEWYRLKLSMHKRGLWALKVMYPNHNWQFSHFKAKGKKFKQMLLLRRVCAIFPNDIVQEEHVLGQPLANPEISTSVATLDIYVPRLRLAFEYQGEQHYRDIRYFGSVQEQEQRDRIKASLCASNGIILIAVPYWWDGKKSSLRATIQIHAPHIQFQKNEEIGVPVRGLRPKNKRYFVGLQSMESQALS